jgi:hypothetical protein
MRRDPLPWLLVLLLVLLVGVAWLTRYPDSPVLDRVVGWPVVGPAAERFRDIYRPAPTPPVEEDGPAEIVVVGHEMVDAAPGVESTQPMKRVWVRAGTELRKAPDPESAVVETLVSIRTMMVMERRGEWSRLSRVGLKGSLTEGWVRQADLGEPSADELWQPEPVVPLAATPPPEEILAEARKVMGEGVREMRCGPFRLLTDVEGPIVESCPRLAGQLEHLYAARTGLEPVGEPAEAILLFDSHGAFLVFRTRVSPQSRRQAFASPARGYIALASGGRLAEQVRATLAHELVHLLNRRFLGPALPSWLDEGLAEELAMSRIAEDGSLEPATLGHWEIGPMGARLMGGGLVKLGGLRSSMRRGDLPTLETLTRLDRADFQAEESFQTHYSLSAFWVRYLLSGDPPAGGYGFRAFLAAVAGGQPLDETLLLTSLGTAWPELETGFRQWLDTSAAEAG